MWYILYQNDRRKYNDHQPEISAKQYDEHFEPCKKQNNNSILWALNALLQRLENFNMTGHKPFLTESKT